MEVISRHKALLRTKQQELRALLNEWNPIGAAGLPEDEYDCFLGLIGDLHRGSSQAEVAAHLREQLAELRYRPRPISARGIRTSGLRLVLGRCTPI